MERERVLIEAIDIGQRNTKKALEIRLPLDAERLTGFWVSVRFPSGHNTYTTSAFNGMLTVYTNLVVGDLSLFTLGKERRFFSFQASVEDPNIGCGDFTGAGFTPKPWSHGLQPDFIPLDIPVSSRLLKGYYRDRMVELVGFTAYKVKLYIWYRPKEKTQKVLPTTNTPSHE